MEIQSQLCPLCWPPAGVQLPQTTNTRRHGVDWHEAHCVSTSFNKQQQPPKSCSSLMNWSQWSYQQIPHNMIWGAACLEQGRPVAIASHALTPIWKKKKCCRKSWSTRPLQEDKIVCGCPFTAGTNHQSLITVLRTSQLQDMVLKLHCYSLDMIYKHYKHVVTDTLPYTASTDWVPAC